MKKTYRNPALTTVECVEELMIATSFDEQVGTTGVNGGEALVKEETPLSSYNVWDDDWNK